MAEASSVGSSPSSVQSLDTKITRDDLADGLLDLLRPAVLEVDDQVKRVRESQVELRQQIDGLAEELKKLSEEQPLPVELDAYVKKLMNSRRRIMVVNNILQNAQTRLQKINSKLPTAVSQKRSAVLSLKGIPDTRDFIPTIGPYSSM
ncbi:SNARE-associated protein Snapin-like isoform X1 [Saccoglossus kowalevskii]|uniref:Biogenesis of lysosome-related organelles complex 1 subunit 7 n=1 Tax=Saccoglossus kowalevskii TaxID=10224 RepID=A0ABM0MY86_SACKO|nr:PREDICTED: SNARE-associated protein Snapin-like isoform X1 [Saccoglossus kowalevskii]